MAGDKEALNFNAVDIHALTVPQQHLFIVDDHLRQLVQMIDDLAAGFAGQILVLCLAYVQRGVPEQTGTVGLHRTHVVGVLMGNENVADGLGVDAQPAHFLRQPVIVVPGIDHDGGIALPVKEDVGHPLPHTGHILVDPTGIQRLEDLLAAIHPAHFLSLELCRFL